jgi:site-specific recombinase XerD
MWRSGSSIVVRAGKGGKRRVIGMDPWGFDALQPWMTERTTLPAGPVFCVLDGPTRHTRAWSTSDVRAQIKTLSATAGIRQRIRPHSLRHSFAVEFWRETGDIYALSRQLGHQNPGITMTYLQGLDPMELVQSVGRRPAPVVPVQFARLAAMT